MTILEGQGKGSETQFLLFPHQETSRNQFHQRNRENSKKVKTLESPGKPSMKTAMTLRPKESTCHSNKIYFQFSSICTFSTNLIVQLSYGHISKVHVVLIKAIVPIQIEFPQMWQGGQVDFNFLDSIVR